MRIYGHAGPIRELPLKIFCSEISILLKRNFSASRNLFLDKVLEILSLTEAFSEFSERKQFKLNGMLAQLFKLIKNFMFAEFSTKTF